MWCFKSRVWKKEMSTNRQIGAVVFGDIRAVTLAENCDLLLDVFNLILCLFQVNNLNGHHLFCVVVYSLVDLSKWAFTNSLQFGEVFLRIQTRILKGENKWFKQERFSKFLPAIYGKIQHGVFSLHRWRTLEVVLLSSNRLTNAGRSTQSSLHCWRSGDDGNLSRELLEITCSFLSTFFIF